MKEPEVESRQAIVYVDGVRAGILAEHKPHQRYTFQYDDSYTGAPASLTLPLRREPYKFNYFPPFFDGLLPEGPQLEALLRSRKIDKADTWAQLMAVGSDLVGNVTVLAEAS